MDSNVIKYMENPPIQKEMIKSYYYCPLCQKNRCILLSRAKLNSKGQFPVGVLQSHSSHSVILYVDANGKIRSVEQVFFQTEFQNQIQAQKKNEEWVCFDFTQNDVIIQKI